MEEIECSFSVIHHDKQVVKKKLTIHTFPHSEVCHLAQLPKLQLRTLGTDGAAFRQAASLTLIVNVAEISCLQVKSRVWIPSPHVALHEVHSPSTHLTRTEKKIQSQSSSSNTIEIDDGNAVKGRPVRTRISLSQLVQVLLSTGDEGWSSRSWPECAKRYQTS